MRDGLAVLGFRAAWRVVRLVPERVAYGAFDLAAHVAWLAWRLAPASHRRRLRGLDRLALNMSRAAPGLAADRHRRLVLDALRSYLRYWCDAFRLPDWSAQRLTDTCRAENDAPLRDALAAGQGVLAAVAHQGNWDHAAAWSAHSLAQVTTVAERLRPEAVSEAFLAFRRRLGIEIVVLGSDGLFATLLRRVRTGGFVPLLADRDLSANGVRVRLLGHPARMAAGPATLALAGGAPLFAATIHYERLPSDHPGRRHGARFGTVVHFHPQVAVPEPEVAGASRPDRRAQVAAMTQACADALSAGIAAHPQDWHMLQRVFDDEVPDGDGPGEDMPGDDVPGDDGTDDGGTAEVRTADGRTDRFRLARRRGRGRGRG